MFVNYHGEDDYSFLVCRHAYRTIDVSEMRLWVMDVFVSVVTSLFHSQSPEFMKLPTFDGCIACSYRVTVI